MISTQSIPKLKLSSIIEEIQDSILLKLFGSEYINVKTLLQTMSQVVKSDGYELELRFIDDKGHTSKQLWNTFLSKSSLFELIEYEDDVIYTYQPSVPIANIHYRSYQKSNIYERKILINSVASRSEDTSIIPLKINLSKESSMSPNKELVRYDNIQRRQRCSYKFNTNSSCSSFLSNWRIDKTIRLFAASLSDKKLSIDLNINNLETLDYYDSLDIEFEFIGPYNEIQNSFFELIRTIYPEYEYFDIEYLIIKHALSTVIPQNMFSSKNILSCMPVPLMMTNDVLQLANIKDYLITTKYSSNHSMVIVFGSPEKYIVYELTNDSLNKLTGSLNILNIGKEISQSSTIDSIVKSFNENKHIDYLPTIYAFEAMTSANNYILTDAIVYDNTLVQDKPLLARREHISNFIKDFKLSDEFTLAPQAKANNWGDILEKRNKPYICKPLNEPLFDSKIYKITYHEQITFNFKVMYVPIKRVFYLYVLGDVNHVIEAKTINNKYSTSHFGYSLLTLSNTPNVDSTNVYLLYVSPYIRESYVLKPSIHTDNKILKDMYESPLKFNNCIIKMTRTNDENASWIPLSIHPTGQPETYTNALKLESLIFDHLRISNYSPNKQLAIIKPIYQSVYELLDQYTIEKAFADKKYKSVLDIINDDNSNVSLLYNIACAEYVYAVSNNKHTLTSYIEQATNKEFNKHTFSSKTLLRNDDLQFSVNSVYSPLTLNSVVSELNKKWNYTPKSIDLVYFEDSFDQIKSLVDVIDFRRVCEEVLSPNGVLVFKIFDGNKVAELIEQKPSVPQSTARKSRRIRSTERTISISYVDDKLLDSHIIDRTKSNSKQFISMLKSSNVTNNISINGNTLTIGKVNVNFPSIYDLSSLCHEQLNTLALVALYHISSANIELVDGSYSYTKQRVLNTTQLINLQKILGLQSELYVNAFNRVYNKFYSLLHDTDKFVGSQTNPLDIINKRVQINEGILIDKQLLSNEDISYIQARLHINYSTVIITETNLDFIPNYYKLNDNTNMFVIYPQFATREDINTLSTYIDNYVIHSNTEDVFKLYTHPKFSSCNYTPRMTFNLDFLNLLYESFKLIDITNPLTQNEIATYIAANRQFTQIASVEQYLNAYTVITAERI